MAHVPLICFYIVEWYFPNRVVRQFRGIQDIPPTVTTEESLHMIDLQGRGTVDWAIMHDPYIFLWIDRHARVIHIEPAQNSADLVTPAYVQWYRRITRRYISKIGAMDDFFVSVVHFYFYSAHIEGILLNYCYLICGTCCHIQRETLTICRQTRNVDEIHARIDECMEECAAQLNELNQGRAVDVDEDEDERLHSHGRG